MAEIASTVNDFNIEGLLVDKEHCHNTWCQVSMVRTGGPGNHNWSLHIAGYNMVNGICNFDDVTMTSEMFVRFGGEPQYPFGSETPTFFEGYVRDFKISMADVTNPS